MHFDYLPEHEMLRDATRGHVERINPIAQSRRGLSCDARRAAWRKDAAQSWAAMLAPDDFGGAGASIVEAMVVGEELGYGAYGGPFIPSNISAALIARYADAETRADLLPAVASGDTIIASPATISACAEVTATPDKAGWRFAGRKRFVQDGDIADLFLVAARTPSGNAYFLLPEGAEGVIARRTRTYDLSHVWCDLEFQDAPINARRIGDEAASAAIAQDARQIASVLTAIDSVGAAARLLDMTVSYAKERQAFGKPIAAFQAIKHRCADMLIQLESARVSAWYAAVAARDDMEDADQAVSIAKFFATEAAAYIAGQALQLHGGIGFTWEHDLHILLKRIKANEAMWGSNSWHRERVAQDIAL